MNAGGWTGHTAWEVSLPLPEARYLTSENGPLTYRGWPPGGTARHLGDGLVRIDALAFGSLSVLPDDADGHVGYHGDTPILSIGGASYQLSPARQRLPASPAG
jgi:hypothetical protein